MNKNKHIWKYRNNEIQLAEFVKLTSTAKQEHINFLLSLGNNILSTNDLYILRMYGPANKIKQFLKLEEDEKENTPNLETGTNKNGKW